MQNGWACSAGHKNAIRQSQSSYLIYLHTGRRHGCTSTHPHWIIHLRLSTEIMSGAKAGSGAVNHIASWRSEMAHIHAAELTRLHRSKFQLSSGHRRVSAACLGELNFGVLIHFFAPILFECFIFAICRETRSSDRHRSPMDIRAEPTR